MLTLGFISYQSQYDFHGFSFIISSVHFFVLKRGLGTNILSFKSVHLLKNDGITKGLEAQHKYIFVNCKV